MQQPVENLDIKSLASSFWCKYLKIDFSSIKNIKSIIQDSYSARSKFIRDIFKKILENKFHVLSANTSNLYLLR